MNKAILIGTAALAAVAGLASAETKSGQVETLNLYGKKITITYSSPAVNGRAGKIFTKDGLISGDDHYPVWRAGANAATALHTEGDLDLGGLAVPKGDYTLFVNIADPDGLGTDRQQADGPGGVGIRFQAGPGPRQDDHEQTAVHGGTAQVHARERRRK